jgi:CubicO group peptidase (beta-lactamase class C family)
LIRFPIQVHMRKLSLLLCLIFMLSFVIPALAVNAAPVGVASATNTTESVIDKYRKLIPQEMQKQRIPGMAIAIVDNNQVVWAEGFGYTDWDRQTPVTADTPFSIQSMSKSFTAAAVMLAVQEGLVDLDTPISQYLPDFHVNSIFEEHPEDKITLRHLLSHTAGFTHDAPVGNNNDVDAGTWQEHIASISNTWLLFPVGTRYNYSNNGIDLAAHIVEVRAGMPFTQYVQTHLLDPLGMVHSTFDIDAIRAMPDRAIGHSVFSQEIPLSPIMAAGGLYTSANDMARYLEFYLNLGKVNVGTSGEAQILNADLVKTMYKGQFPASAAQGYGLGLTYYRSHDVTNTLEIEHGGGGFGFLSDMAWFPQLNFGLVWLSNSSDHNLQSWLTGQIINDYIDANRTTLASRASLSLRFTQKTFGPEDPPVLSDASLVGLIKSKALADSVEAVTRRRAYTGYYAIGVWGLTGEIHRVGLKDGSLTLDGTALTEVQPGLFFDNNGEVVDMRGPVFYLRNLPLEKISQGTVIFYEIFLGFCGLACLVFLFWYPAGWSWNKIRHKTLKTKTSWSAWVAGLFIILAALVGIFVLGVILKYPALLAMHRIIMPTAELPIYQYIALLTPYILLGFTLIAAIFSGLGWRKKTPKDRWIEVGKIALLLVYAIVII